VTCGIFTDDGTVLDMPEFDEDRILALWSGEKEPALDIAPLPIEGDKANCFGLK
jgi:hypothetical protein